MEPNIANRVVSTPASFWEVPGSNLVLAARYPVIGFRCFSQSPQVSDELSYISHNRFLPHISILSFINHPFI
jgi:hypothetical protein